MAPVAKPGPMTEEERFMFDSTGYLVIPDALTPGEVEACLAAARRAHAPYPQGEWRQLGHLYETEPAIEALMDHPSILPKVRALLGDYFILQSTWCTLQPAHGKAGRYHQDGSGVYEFRRLAIPTPLVQLRVGYFLTDQSRDDMGNMVMIPGSHNAALRLPKTVQPDTDTDLPIREVITGKPGAALLFHQGVFHRTGVNNMDFDRYTMHIVYAPPWLIPSDRMENSQEFLERTTPLRKALVGEWKRPEEPFGMGYDRPPFEN
ncbi:MAG: phytanoyl-CoA dioxygenase family protein [Chloroflexi bacterium]|nr:phytanoyl-CoA dioxygenase family protein [Chloroflexota bacterium]